MAMVEGGRGSGESWEEEREREEGNGRPKWGLMSEPWPDFHQGQVLKALGRPEVPRPAPRTADADECLAIYSAKPREVAVERRSDRRRGESEVAHGPWRPRANLAHGPWRSRANLDRCALSEGMLGLRGIWVDGGSGRGHAAHLPGTLTGGESVEQLYSSAAPVVWSVSLWDYPGNTPHYSPRGCVCS